MIIIQLSIEISSIFLNRVFQKSEEKLIKIRTVLQTKLREFLNPVFSGSLQDHSAGSESVCNNGEHFWRHHEVRRHRRGHHQRCQES